MRDSLKIASVIIGTIVGAGLSSGQEILIFFGLYGKKGFLGILICCLIYILLLYVVIDLTLKFNLKSYRDLVILVLGEKLGTVVELIMTFFIFSGNVIMLSGCGALLNEYFGINKLTGIIIVTICVFIISIYSTKGLVAINSFIVPFSTITILIITVLVLIKAGTGSTIENSIKELIPFKKNFLLSTFLYSTFNITGVTGVVCPMVNEYRNKAKFFKGCIIGSVVLTLLALSINLSIILEAPGSFYCEIPNLFIAKKFGIILPMFVSIAILLEMFSTQISELYSLSKRIETSTNFSHIFTVALILTFTIPFTFIGFANLISIVYPAYGYIGLLISSGCLIKWGFNIKYR